MTINHLTCVFRLLLLMVLSAAFSEGLSCECEMLENEKVCRLNQVDNQWIIWNADNVPIKDEDGNFGTSIAAGCGQNCIKVKNRLSVISVNFQSSDMMEDEEVQCKETTMEKVDLQTEDPGQNSASKTGFDVFIVFLIILIFYII